MSLSLVTAPTAEPVSVALAKVQCRVSVDQTDEDGLFEEVLIPAARDRAELATRRAMRTQTWDYVLDEFWCGDLVLPKPPLQSVTWIRYIDSNSVTQTLATTVYATERPVGARCRPGRIRLAYGQFWPTPISQAGAVTVRFVAGYAYDAVPPLLIAGMLMDIDRLYEHRGNFVTGAIVADIPGRASEIYRSYKVHA